MTKEKELKWRLGSLPTPSEVRELVQDKIITQKEARNILFRTETEEDRDKDSLQQEIKFLRKLVDKISTKPEIRETIRYIEKPYYDYGWYKPYAVWCSGTITADTGNSTLTSNSVGTGTALYVSSNLSDIKNF